jgi:two-component system sensor histidine kinase/response regulator
MRAQQQQYMLQDKPTIKFSSSFIGNPAEFPLESRIFHGICIGLIVLSGVYVPYNLIAGLYVGSVSALLLCLFFSYQYYYSRYRSQPHNNFLFGFAGILIFGLNYFSNSGIHGSTDIIWPSYLLLVFAITPYRQHLKWLIAYLISFLIVHGLEYYYPQLVKHPFQLGSGQFIDRITAFPLPVIGIYIVIKFIRRGYDKERQTTEEKSLAIEISKEKISLQKDQLEQSNMEKSKLMSIVSHDLRAPLVNIQGYLELLAKNEIDQTERAMLEKALLTSTSNTLEMLSNLLHWSKSQMEGTTLKLLAINLLDTLLSTFEMEKMYASKKGISLNFDVSATIKVIADVDMLQLVVRNLIGNAVKFTPPGGKIDIKAQMVTDNCKLSITDNGNGIAKDKQEDIFSIRTISSYGTNNEKGVGLGLFLCKEFIERQGGTVGFESDLGMGSSFFIFLPLAKA